MQDFFIICPLNLESIVLQELKLKWPLFYDTELPSTNIVQGGIEVTLPMEQGLSLNHILKTANRVLLRLKNQKCRDFPKLYNIICKFNWKSITKVEEIKWNITCKKSRLINTTKIENTCTNALKKYFNANKIPQKVLAKKDEYQIQNIFLRIENDDLTLSLDTSGELLHIRGGDSFRGLASIRSTLACALLLSLNEKQDNPKVLIDPMCGTATFLKEARDLFLLPTRKFAYQDWFDRVVLNGKTNKDHTIYNQLIGHDLETSIIERNIKANPGISFKVSDIFSNEEFLFKDLHTTVICNPPYGKRIKLSKNRHVFYTELIQSIKKKYKPDTFGIIIPSDINIPNYHSKLRFFNSGIWLNFYRL